MKNRQLLTHNAQTVLQLLLKRLNVTDNSSWQNNHEEHPDYPSLASFHYLLRKRGVESVAIRTTYEELAALPAPILVHISENKGTFLLVDKTDADQIYIINEKNELEPTPVDYFKKVWDGNAMVFDTENIRIAPEHPSIKIKRLFAAAQGFGLMAAAMLILAGILIRTSPERTLHNQLYLGAYTIGLLIAILFLIRQFNANHPLVNKICHAKPDAQKTGCASILDSPAAYFKGLFSWSDFGFVYFASLFTLMLSIPGSLSVAVAATASLLSFPYIIYSLWYQARIARSWCQLCLATQAVLFLLFIITLFALPAQIDTWQQAWLVPLLPLAVITGYATLKPLYTQAGHYTSYKKQYNQLKQNDQLFDALTALQPDIDTATVDKLTLNPEGTDTLTVIFNPTCQPCMQKIPQLFQLYRTKQNTRIELIFFLNAQAPPTDDSYTLAKAMIREYETDPDRFPEMLSQYASHYPNRVKPLLTKYKHAGRENQRLQQSLANQTAWCLQNNIFATPQLLFNHKKVPDLYTLSDIDYRCD